jgi:hypothetical protein
MSDERDPVLEALFSDAGRNLADDGFSDAVLTRIEARRRRIIAGRLTIAALIVAFELWLDAPLQHSLGALADALNTPLFEIGHQWFGVLLAPLNSLAGIVGLLLLGIHFLYRRLFY